MCSGTHTKTTPHIISQIQVNPISQRANPAQRQPPRCQDFILASHTAAQSVDVNCMIASVDL